MFTKMISCCFSHARRQSELQDVLKAESISILSASCCDPSGASKEKALQRNVTEALKRLREDEAVHTVTITSAQAGIRDLPGRLDKRQQRLVDTIVILFESHGLSVFPMLIVDGRIGYYGGVPSVDMISEKLRARAAKAAQPAAHAHE